MKKEQMVAMSIRISASTKMYLNGLSNTQEHIRECISIGTPDLLNPPVIETASFEYGYMAFEDGYCGCGDCNSVLGIGKTKEIAKQDFLDKWREQQ